MEYMEEKGLKDLLHKKKEDAPKEEVKEPKKKEEEEESSSRRLEDISYTAKMLYDKGYWKDAKTYYILKSKEVKKATDDLWKHLHEEIMDESYMKKLKEIQHEYDIGNIPHNYQIEMPDLRTCIARYKKISDDIHSSIRIFINKDYKEVVTLKKDAEKIVDIISDGVDQMNYCLKYRLKTISIPAALDIVDKFTNEKGDIIDLLLDVKDEVKAFSQRIDRLENNVDPEVSRCIRDVVLKSQKMMTDAINFDITYGKKIAETGATIFKVVSIPINKEAKEKDVKESAMAQEFYNSLNELYMSRVSRTSYVLENAMLMYMEEENFNHVVTEKAKRSFIDGIRAFIASIVTGLTEFVAGLKRKVDEVVRTEKYKASVKNAREKLQNMKDAGETTVTMIDIEKLRNMYNGCYSDLHSQLKHIQKARYTKVYQIQEDMENFNKIADEWDAKLTKCKETKVKMRVDRALTLVEDEIKGKTNIISDINGFISEIEKTKTELESMEKKVAIQGESVFPEHVNIIKRIITKISNFFRKWAVIIVVGAVMIFA